MFPVSLSYQYNILQIVEFIIDKTGPAQNERIHLRGVTVLLDL